MTTLNEAEKHLFIKSLMLTMMMAWTYFKNKINFASADGFFYKFNIKHLSSVSLFNLIFLLNSEVLFPPKKMKFPTSQIEIDHVLLCLEIFNSISNNLIKL